LLSRLLPSLPYSAVIIVVSLLSGWKREKLVVRHDEKRSSLPIANVFVSLATTVMTEDNKTAPSSNLLVLLLLVGVDLILSKMPSAQYLMSAKNGRGGTAHIRKLGEGEGHVRRINSHLHPLFARSSRSKWEGKKVSSASPKRKKRRNL